MSAILHEANLRIWLFSSLPQVWEPAYVVSRHLPGGTLTVETPHFSSIAMRELASSTFDGDRAGCQSGRMTRPLRDQHPYV